MKHYDRPSLSPDSEGGFEPARLYSDDAISF
jgi:hypothetical protein